MINKLDLFKSIHPIRLAVFRIGFGFFACLEVLYFYKTHLIEDYILGPKHLFHYHFAPLEPLSPILMQAVLFFCLLSAIGILLGKFYRQASIGFFFSYSYLFFLEKSYYNNHLYLIALLALLMIFIPANGALSLDKKPKGPALNWHLQLLRVQFFIVYFFGGIAKINYDWLVLKEPARMFLISANPEAEFLLPVIVWGGMLFDLLIGFFLFMPRTRLLAIIAVLIFNISNHFLFDDINIFPFFMMASLVLFMRPEQWGFLSKYSKTHQAVSDRSNSNKVLKYVLSVYLLVQIILPLRHYVLTKEVDWTSEAQRFAWRMKIQGRAVEAMSFQILDPTSKTIYPVTLNQHISTYQQGQMSFYPYMMLDFAHYLGEYAKANGVRNPMIKADVRVSLNGRAAQAVFSPDLDLLSVEWKTFGGNDWINTLKTEGK